MAYKIIPQVEFDKAVQKIMTVGLGRRPAESLVLIFWKISQDLKRNFRLLIDNAVRGKKLNVDKRILDQINLTKPPTVRYAKTMTVSSFSLVTNEAIYNEYQYITEDAIDLESEDERDLMAE